MAISIDLDLVARPRILSGPSITETIGIAGGLGTDQLNSAALVDPVSTVVDLTGDLTGGRLALRGTISTETDLSTSRRRLWVQSAPTNYAMYPESADPWVWLYRTRTMLDPTDQENPVVSAQVIVRSNVDTWIAPAMTIPDPPAPAPPEDPEEPGNFPIPSYGGVTIRALHGVVVDMDPPVIDDGIPT